MITDNSEDAISYIKQLLSQAFSIKDLGNLCYFLGIEVSHYKKGIFLFQRKYTLGILSDYVMTSCRPSYFPMEQHFCLQPNDKISLSDPIIYLRLIDLLLYITVTWPDIQYIVNTLSQFNLHIPLILIRSHDLFLSESSSINLVGYNNYNWAHCLTTRRSTTIFFTMFCSNCISWKTKKQPTISRSFAE